MQHAGLDLAIGEAARVMPESSISGVAVVGGAAGLRGRCCARAGGRGRVLVGKAFDLHSRSVICGRPAPFPTTSPETTRSPLGQPGQHLCLHAVGDAEFDLAFFQRAACIGDPHRALARSGAGRCPRRRALAHHAAPRAHHCLGARRRAGPGAGRPGLGRRAPGPGRVRPSGSAASWPARPRRRPVRSSASSAGRRD